MSQDDDIVLDADPEEPDFANAGRVHDWRNYVGKRTRALWTTLSQEQRRAIALDAQGIADGEDWE